MESAGTSALKPGGHYTLEDYRNWPAEERWELIYGIAYSMSPAPLLKHQRLLGSIFNQLGNQLNDKPFEPFIAPVDVYPFPDSKDEEINTVVQPDLIMHRLNGNTYNPPIGTRLDAPVEISILPGVFLQA